jgi:outer membrane lipoprotein-sorting protein
MKKLFFLFILALSFGSTVSAQSVDDLLKKYYETAGGVEQWKTLKSTKTIGKANQMGMEFPFTMVQTRPNKQKLVVDIQGMQYVEAFDGKTAWTINPFVGGTTPTKKSDEESTEAAKQLFEDKLVNYAKKGHKVSLEGREEVEGVNTMIVKLSTAEGDDYFYYFDPENHVPIMVKSFATTGEMKGMAVEQYMSDYQAVNGLMMPHSMTTKVSGQVVASLTFTSIEFNVPVTDAEFSFPGK